MTGNEKSGDDKFEAELKAAMMPVPASANLKREILLLPLEFPRLPRQVSDTDDDFQAEPALRRSWYAAVLTPMSLGAFAAAASLALGIFAGIGGLGGQSQSADEVDIAGLAYDQVSNLGDL